MYVHHYSKIEVYAILNRKKSLKIIIVIQYIQQIINMSYYNEYLILRGRNFIDLFFSGNVSAACLLTSFSSGVTTLSNCTITSILKVSYTQIKHRNEVCQYLKLRLNGCDSCKQTGLPPAPKLSLK